MATPTANIPQSHSPAWIAQVWISFVVATVVTGFGIWFIPATLWIKAFLGMGLLFSVASSFSLAKTMRDLHESQRVAARIDEARFHRLITEHDPLSPPA